MIVSDKIGFFCSFSTILESTEVTLKYFHNSLALNIPFFTRGNLKRHLGLKFNINQKRVANVFSSSFLGALIDLANKLIKDKKLTCFCGES